MTRPYHYTELVVQVVGFCRSPVGVYVTCVPTTQNQGEVPLYLCIPIQTPSDIFLGESASCSACDFTMTRLDPSSSQADSQLRLELKIWYNDSLFSFTSFSDIFLEISMCKNATLRNGFKS